MSPRQRTRKETVAGTVATSPNRAFPRLKIPAPDRGHLPLGGDFIVGRDGRLVHVFRSTDPDHRPTVDELLDAVARA
jgi:hypothetical protein